MKYLLLLSLLALCQQSIAQAPICGIYFDHDASGNRIKRSYACRVHPDPNGPVVVYPPGPTSRQVSGQPAAESAAGTTVTVYPNPTSGPYTIALSEVPKKPVHFHWYNERGQILTSGQITGRDASGGIGAWPDGIYLLQVYAPGGTQSFRVVKKTEGR